MTVWGRIYDVAQRQREGLLRTERQAASELVRAYGGVWQRVQDEVDRLLSARDAATANGETVGPGWLFEMDRLQRLQQQVQVELRQFAQYADPLIAQTQGQAIAAALDYSEELVKTAAHTAKVQVNWARLPQGPLHEMIGFTADGSPLYELLNRAGPVVGERVRDGLIQGLALGQNPREIAGQLRGAFGGGLTQALTVCRTEFMRSYREATRLSYGENDDVVTGWVWNAACTPRTCAMCWAMHGTTHLLTEQLDDHPNGRCAMLPLVKGIPGMSAQALPDDGISQFEKLDADTQRSILGPALFNAYQAGEVKLPDIVGRSFSKDWGSMRRVKSLSEIVGADRALETKESRLSD